MYILLDKRTGIIEDIVEQPFDVTFDFEWVEDAKITYTDIKKIYDKNTKKITEPPRAEVPRDFVSEKLATLEARIAEISGEPILGVAEKTSVNYMYFFVIPLVLIAYFLGKKTHKFR